MNLTSFIRYLQGERPGMRAGRFFESPEILSLFYPSIIISNTIRLADVSYYQDEIDFAVMRAAGIAGVIIRAGQRNWVDSRFRENWGKAKTAGLPRGSYWLYDSREDPKTQAALWWSLIKDDTGELVHVADFEESYGGPYGSRAHFKEFLIEFQRLSGLPDSRIAIYTGFYWWVDRVGNDTFFSRYSLWLAWYAAMANVRVPEPWEPDDLLFWQYTSSGNGTAYGVSSLEIDLNWYCCDVENFKARFNVDISTPTPPNGGPMWYRVNTTKLNIRLGPGTNYVDIGDLFLGDLVEAVDPPVSGWLHIRSAMRGGFFMDLPDLNNSWCSGAYCVAVDPPVTPPPPEGDPDFVVAHWVASGKTRKYIPE